MLCADSLSYFSAGTKIFMRILLRKTCCSPANRRKLLQACDSMTSPFDNVNIPFRIKTCRKLVLQMYCTLCGPLKRRPTVLLLSAYVALCYHTSKWIVLLMPNVLRVVSGQHRWTILVNATVLSFVYQGLIRMSWVSWLTHDRRN